MNWTTIVFQISGKRISVDGEPADDSMLKPMDVHFLDIFNLPLMRTTREMN